MFVARARAARADQPDAHARAGPGAGRADAQVAAAAGSTSASRSSTRCCPRATGCTSSSRASAAASRRSTSASSCVTRRPAARPGRARQPDRAGGGVPRGVRCAPGSTSWSPAAPRPARPRCSTAWPRDPRRRAGGQRRGGLRAAVHPSRLGRDADPAARARGHRRDRAARPGQGGAADAAEPDHRRRGAGGGVPRPAARPQRRAARACARSTPTAPARRWSRCAPCRCSPARTSPPGSWCRRSRRSVDLVVHLGIDARRRTPGQRDRRRAGPGRERRHRDRAGLRARRGGELVGAGGHAAAAGAFERRGIDVHARSSTRSVADGRARRARGRRRPAARLVGVRPAAPPAPARPRPARPRPRELLARAGLGQVRRRLLVVCAVGVRRRRFVVQVVSRTPPVAARVRR